MEVFPIVFKSETVSMTVRTNNTDVISLQQPNHLIENQRLLLYLKSEMKSMFDHHNSEGKNEAPHSKSQ